MRAERYRQLGLRPVINAAATLTRLGGSRLAPPAVVAMAEASCEFVDVPELQRRVGARLAELTGNTAGYVTSGAAAGITLSVAACVTGPEPSTVEVFPAMTGMTRTRVAMFRGHRNPYDYNARLLGAEIVEFGADLASMEAAIGADTACVLWFAGAHYAEGAPPLSEVVALAKARGVAVLVDAAAQIPPISSLWDFTAGLGADAVLVSGGKGLRGPQSSGLVLGSTAVIEGCRAHASPRHGVGRGMKVGKEEMLGLLAAVEWSLQQDEPALLAEYEKSVTRWVEGLGGLPGVRVERGYPSEAGQPHGRALVHVSAATGWTTETLVKALWENDPRIAVNVVGDAIALNPQTLEPGEDVLVLYTLRSLLGAR
ncbi:aminotransferase class V-fold PLP-dependent enzyme [Amycolatopsis sp. NPDC059027]|uniref:aminotransferase class V-fold PLP-dependent enzyme n=1 Tax=unclassified Amycolatopsis TaxID=2618356 RepID=UPI00366BEFFD